MSCRRLILIHTWKMLSSLYTGRSSLFVRNPGFKSWVKQLKVHIYTSLAVKSISQLVVWFLCFFAVFLIVFILVIHIFIILFLFILSFLLCLLSFLLILFILHFLLSILGDCPEVFTRLLGLSRIVRDHDVIEDCARLHLPQVESKFAEFVVFAQVLGIVGVVLWVVDLGVDPRAFVCGVVDLPGLPLSLPM